MKDITHLDYQTARTFFLAEDKYINFDLPPYFKFDKLLKSLSDNLEGKEFNHCLGTYINSKAVVKPTYPVHSEDVNYAILNNKDGKYSWRPLQLIHPVLYVALVHCITTEDHWTYILKKFAEFRSDKNISCYSLPLLTEGRSENTKSAISNWLSRVEQQSIELALRYEYLLHTDITDCYGAIYTHSIAWALHTKPVSKLDRDPKTLLGNKIDNFLCSMSHGQTNGIPQGSILMDFIAEMVLGYADSELSKRIQGKGIADFRIVRYRDDYRIFSNSPQEAELIAKELTEVLIELGMRLNASKTTLTNQVVRDSIKPDKRYWLGAKRSTSSLQGHLLLIHGLSQQYPNSGSVVTSLIKYYRRIDKLSKTKSNIPVLTSILTDIMYKNPRVYPVGIGVLSKLLSFLESEPEKLALIALVEEKFLRLPNTGHLKVWLQRLTLKFQRDKEFDESLCKKVNEPSQQLWNSAWLNGHFQKIVNETPLVDEGIIADLDSIVGRNEFDHLRFDYEYEATVL